MSTTRIVVETLCEHGRSEGEHWVSVYHDESMRCPGGSRRVLTEGQYVLIEKVDGEWPEELICELLDIAETEPRGIDKAAAHWQSRLDALAAGDTS